MKRRFKPQFLNFSIRTLSGICYTASQITAFTPEYSIEGQLLSIINRKRESHQSDVSPDGAVTHLKLSFAGKGLSDSVGKADVEYSAKELRPYPGNNHGN